MVVKVAVDTGEFVYKVPDELKGIIKIGSVVKVKLRKKEKIGFVTEINPEYKKGIILKYVDDVIKEFMPLPERLIKFAKWCANYYAGETGKILKSAIPKLIKEKLNVYVKLKELPQIESEKEKILAKLLLTRIFGVKLKEIEGKDRRKISSLPVEYIVKREYKLPEVKFKTEEKPPQKLTSYQEKALEKILPQIKKHAFKVFLLHGVNGSGKTEVYMRVIEEVLKMGKTAILLTPEISLTTQMLQRFEARFGEKVGVWHSRLSDRERFDIYHEIVSGKKRIIIGARSVIFLPLKAVGVIICDEEHDTSYKHEESPRYNARVSAVMRARAEKCVCILGTATPSLETYQNALKGKFELIELPERVDGAPLPEIKIIDMRKEENKIISDYLREKIIEKVKKGEKIILFLNRRGYANYLLCRDCGYVPRCQKCDISLTLHLKDKVLRCHYCGYRQELPDTCPECGSAEFIYAGAGTERVEEEIKKILPKVKLVRMDLDTVTYKDAYWDKIHAFESGAQILLGTQMVVHGLHFPKVSLCAIINIDNLLTLPDFRAYERVFQLVMQTAGRAGRGGIPGEVILQTFMPEHPLMKFIRNYDYKGFFKWEIKRRKELNYPPFTHLIRIVVERRKRDSAKEVCEKLKEELEDKADVIGYSICPIEKRSNLYRYHLLLRTENPLKITPFLKNLKGVKIDVDPIDIM